MNTPDTANKRDYPKYHWRDGWYFERGTNGNVVITPPKGDNVGPIIIPYNEWASIIAAVSEKGETGEQYQAALKLHNSE